MSCPGSDKEIAFLTRSILEVLTDLSSHIDVPEAHVRTTGWGRRQKPIWDLRDQIPDLIRITSSTERPLITAFVALLIGATGSPSITKTYAPSGYSHSSCSSSRSWRPQGAPPPYLDDPGQPVRHPREVYQ